MLAQMRGETTLNLYMLALCGTLTMMLAPCALRPSMLPQGRSSPCGVQHELTLRSLCTHVQRRSAPWVMRARRSEKSRDSRRGDAVRCETDDGLRQWLTGMCEEPLATARDGVPGDAPGEAVRCDAGDSVGHGQVARKPGQRGTARLPAAVAAATTASALGPGDAVRSEDGESVSCGDKARRRHGADVAGVVIRASVWLRWGGARTSAES